MPIRPVLAVDRDSSWHRRLQDPGWLLLPVRGFLGVTFCIAGLQKLANPDYLDPHSPTSVAAQMRSLQHSSPIGPLLGLSTHAPVLVGLLIAFGELAVGIGTLLGLYTRVAAVGGLLLSLTFFLTVSWNTTPYYYGSDIVFVFAWLTMFAFGPASGLSLDSWLRNRARRSMGLGAEAAEVGVEVNRLRSLCPIERHCGLQPDGHCARRRCPVFPTPPRSAAAVDAEVDRRTVMRTGGAAAIVAAGAALLGGATAAIGRAVRGSDGHAAAGHAPALPPSPSSRSHAVPRHRSRAASSPPVARGTVIGTVAGLPVGKAKSFTDPGTGGPAWVVHPSGSEFVAFSAICTHAGCPVQYDPATVQFVCPCHGGVYNARTGQVVSGPPPAPLQTIPINATGGQLRVSR